MTTEADKDILLAGTILWSDLQNIVYRFIRKWEYRMERLQAFEAMLHDIQEQYEKEKKAMEELKAKGREKTATYRQYLGNRLLYGRMLDLYKQYDLLHE